MPRASHTCPFTSLPSWIYKYIDTLPACVVRLEILSEEGQKEEKEGEEAIWRGPV